MYHDDNDHDDDDDDDNDEFYQSMNFERRMITLERFSVMMIHTYIEKEKTFFLAFTIYEFCFYFDLLYTYYDIYSCTQKDFNKNYSICVHITYSKKKICFRKKKRIKIVLA